jgi:hypothetical protein
MLKLLDYTVPANEIDVRTSVDDIPVEDYNEDNDYSFGMKRILRTLAFVTVAVFVISIASTL